MNIMFYALYKKGMKDYMARHVSRKTCSGRAMAPKRPLIDFSILCPGKRNSHMFQFINSFHCLIYEKFDDILGITYKNKNGRIHRNPDRPYIEELDELPYPAYNLFPIDKYKVLGRIEYPIQMSRGCAFNCNYCSTVRMHGRKFRVREPKRVVDEIEFLMKEYGATYVGFIDDAFTLNLDKTREFLDEMMNRTE